MSRQRLRDVALVVLVLLVITAGTAVAVAPGSPFRLGVRNAIDQLTKLAGTAASAMLRVTNNGTGPALELRVLPGSPPLTVNSTTQVANLNADEVDGKSAADFLAADGKAQDSVHADHADSATTAAFASDAATSADATELGGILPSGYAQVGSCQDGLVHGWAWVLANSSFSVTYINVSPNSKNCAGGSAQARRASTGMYFVRFPNNGSAIAVGNLFEVDATATSSSSCADDYVAIDYVADPTISGGQGPRVFRIQIHDDGGGLEDCPFDLLIV